MICSPLSIRHQPTATERPSVCNCCTFILILLRWVLQVLVQSGHIPMVYLECVSCKAQSLYEVSQNSYVYLRGTCSNCQGFHRGVRTHSPSPILCSDSGSCVGVNRTSADPERRCLSIIPKSCCVPGLSHIRSSLRLRNGARNAGYANEPCWLHLNPEGFCFLLR